MKKICYVVTIPLTIRAFFIPQLKHLAENGFDVSVVCSPDPKLQEELGPSVRYIPLEIPRGISLGGSLRAIKQLRALFVKEKFDMVQYSTPNAAFYASRAAKKAGIRVRNYHLMGLRFLGENGIKRRILKTLEASACRNSTSVECVSPSNREMCIQYGLTPEQKVTVVWNGSTGGVDTDRFSFANRAAWRQEIRQELGYEENDILFGFVGRITRDKGVNELLEAFMDLHCPNCKLLMIGQMEGEETLDPQLLTRARNHENIRFHGFVQDIERYYGAMDVLVLPSYREGFGNVVIEAAAVGTPAIVSNIPGPVDAVVPEKTALLVPVKDTQALKNAMQRMAEADYRSFGINAHEYVRESFDSRLLNKKITDRKRQLLEDC